MPTVRHVAPDTATAALDVVDLQVERQTEPMAVDEDRPLFGWRLRGSGGDRAQQAYRIRVTVDTDPTAESAAAVWDSGEVTSSRSYDIPYGGAALAARTRFRWAVRVCDEAGRWSEWARSWFETARLDAADWAVTEWITAPETVVPRIERPSLDQVPGQAEIRWIGLPAWAPEASEMTFRQTFDLPAEERVASVASTVAGGGVLTLIVNDVDVPLTDGGADDIALRDALRPGTNEVRLRVYREATDLVGVIARIEVLLDGGATVSVATDGRWRYTTTATGSPDPGSWPFAPAIGAHGDPPWGRQPVSYRPSPYLRRDLNLPAEVARARLYATALGVYEARLNGRRVGDAHLAPGWTDYPTRLTYQVHDVTDLMREGDNTVGAVIADGWYAGHLAHIGPRRYGDRPCFRARLDIDLVDGTTISIGTDDSWRAGTGRTRDADLQNGEVVDARLEPAGWDAPGFDAAAWPPAQVAEPAHGSLEAQTAPPITVGAQIPAVRVSRRADGAQIVDFGQNVVGWVRLRATADAGARIMIRHAEVLDDTAEDAPVLYTDALRTARCTDEFVPAGLAGGEVFEPRFTFHGFRFCEIIGAPPVSTADVTAVVAHAAMTPTGRFTCSDRRLNRLHENIVWGQRGNFLAVPTDCPQRDERMGWTGDATVFGATAAFGYDVRGFLRSWLRDVRGAQLPNGAVTHVVPDVFALAGGGNPAGDGGAAGWGDVIVELPRVLAMSYGDLRSIEENLDAMARWLDYCDGTREDGVRPVGLFGDWLALVDTPQDLVSTAFLAYAARTGARLAERVGRVDLAERWRDLYADVRGAFRRRWVRGGGTISPDSQTAYALALSFGLFDDDEKTAAAGRLAADVRSRHWHLTTGFLGTPYLLPALSENGQEDVAFRLLVQDSWPSWLYQVVHGDATTIWERWDSWSESRGFQNPSMTSFNHYAYGAVGDWIYRNVGGLAIADDGPEHLVIRPRPGGGITSARTVRTTVLGDVVVDWRLDDDGFRLDLTVPVGARAEVVLPGSEEESVLIGSGEHRFEVESALVAG